MASSAQNGSQPVHVRQPPAVPRAHSYDPPRVAKVPTGLGAEPLNIVILGASYSGLAVAHRFLDHAVNHLRVAPGAPTYRLVIINPSTHFYWNAAAPRAVVEPDLLNDSRLFVPIEETLHRHRAHNVSLFQGEATALDTSARTVTVELIGKASQHRASQIIKRRSVVIADPTGKRQMIPYHALIIATGSSAHSELLGSHGPHIGTMGALNSFHARLETTTGTIVVGGGGCSAVETAGQLAVYLKRVKQQDRRLVLITGAETCLPSLLNQTLSVKAETQLAKLGVEVIHRARIIAAKEAAVDYSSQTRLELSNGSSILADLYIPCTGSNPNTAFAPLDIKSSSGHLWVNASTLRVDEALAGPRVYAVGDCANYNRRRLSDVYDAVPVLVQNLQNDLIAHEHRSAGGKLDGQVDVDALKDAVFVPRKDSKILIPIGRVGGVGLWKGRCLPGLLVYWWKGRDFWLKQAVKVAEGGSL